MRLFRREIKPRLGPDAEHVREADARAKRELLARGQRLVFPICWEEPFGMVMIEAMACGTPVVALGAGGARGDRGRRHRLRPDDPEQLPEGIELARLLDPEACQAHVAANFTTEVMAARYEEAYLRVLAETPAPAAMATAGLPTLSRRR